MLAPSRPSGDVPTGSGGATTARLLGAVARRLPTGSLPYKLADRLERLVATPRLRTTAYGREVAVFRLAGHLRVVGIEPGLPTEDLVRRNLDLVVDTLTTAGVPFFVAEARADRRARVGVASVHRHEALHALARTWTETPVYLNAPRVARCARVHDDLAVHSAPAAARAGCPIVSVFHRWFDPLTRHHAGRQHACMLEFWDEDEDGRFTVPHVGPASPALPAAARTPATIEFAGRRYPSLTPFAAPRSFELREPVDVVYLWVDGDDPAWLARRAAALGEDVALHPDASGAHRFRHFDELRYSMRSLERFAPWVRRVHLVTDRQVPSWLRTDVEDLVLVDHRELFGDAGAAPSFNSHAIHARVHHIDGLAERYLVVNDDVLFGRPVGPERFFDANGCSRFFISRSTLPAGPPAPEDPPHEAARKRVRDLVERDFGARPIHAMWHTPIPMQRSLMFELEDRFPEEFARTWNSRFRSHEDLEVGWLHHYYGYHLGRTIPGKIRYAYVNVGRERALRSLDQLARRRPAESICVNDDDGEVPVAIRHEAMERFFRSYFPNPSRFERTG